MNKVKVLVCYVSNGLKPVDCFDFGFSKEDDQIVEFFSEIKENCDSPILFKWVTLADHVVEGDSWESEEALKALNLVLFPSLTDTINAHAASINNSPKGYGSIDKGIAVNQYRAVALNKAIVAGHCYNKAASIAQAAVVTKYGEPT